MALAACSSSGSSSGAAGTSSNCGTITVAVVSNPLITGQMIPLTQSVFEKQNPGITVKFATYTEGDLRAAIEKDVSTHSNAFNVIINRPVRDAAVRQERHTAMNVPLAIWMIRSFMLEVPNEMLEAARLDGAGRIREMTEVIMPVISPGLVSTALICVIFAWNELFLALNLTVTNAATLPMFLISSVPQEGLYIAHPSAAATVASVPVILVGWIAQRSLVRGLSMGAIK